MIKLKNLIKEFTDKFGNEYIEHGDGYIIDEKQIVIFKNTKNMYKIQKNGDVKFIKKLSKQDMDNHRAATPIKDAGIIKDPKTKKLRWEY